MEAGRKKLTTVARLYHLDRAKFGRTCEECAASVFDESTGRVRLDRTRSRPGRPVPLARDKRTEPPCHECPKTVGLEVRHWSHLKAEGGDPPEWCYHTFRHFRRCEAVQWQTPDAADHIVQANAERFAAVRRDAESGRNEGLLVALGILKKHT